MTSTTALPTEQIRRHARGAVDLAGVKGQYPVPLDAVEHAVGLHPAQALWDAGRQMPPGIRAIANKLRLSGKILGGLALPDRRIYLDMSMAVPRKRYVHGHEIGHQALPWHQGAYYGDDQTTLVSDVRDELEAQANAFSAELLFGDRFTRESDDVAPGMTVPLSMTGTFEVSAHAALRRYAETSRHDVALLVLGRYTRQSANGPALPVWVGQCASSASFADRYGQVTGLITSSLPIDGFPSLRTLMSCDGPRVVEDTGDVALATRRGQVVFKVDAFTNTRCHFLLLYRRRLTSGRGLRST